MTNQAHVNFHMDEVTYAVVREVARREFRPIGRQIELIINEWLERHPQPSPDGSSEKATSQ